MCGDLPGVTTSKAGHLSLRGRLASVELKNNQPDCFVQNVGGSGLSTQSALRGGFRDIWRDIGERHYCKMKMVAVCDCEVDERTKVHCAL